MMCTQRRHTKPPEVAPSQAFVIQPAAAAAAVGAGRMVDAIIRLSLGRRALCA